MKSHSSVLWAGLQISCAFDVQNILLEAMIHFIKYKERNKQTHKNNAENKPTKNTHKFKLIAWQNKNTRSGLTGEPIHKVCTTNLHD
jgi:hypothetical protein